SDHHLEELSPAVDSAQQRVACNLFTQYRLFVFVTGSGFVMQSFKPSRSQVAQRVVSLFWRKLLFDPGLGGHRPNAIQIARPHAIRSPREQMERRVNLRSAGYADALGDCLAKLFRNAADDSLASHTGRRRSKSAPPHCA